MSAAIGLSHIAVLMYHSVDASGSAISVKPATFRTQMQTLYRQGYRGVALRELLEKTESSKAGKQFILTFDDAYLNFSHCAAPILQELNFSATLFVISDWVGRHNGWSQGRHRIPRLSLLDWPQLKELSENGFEIACHSRSHRSLPDLDFDQLQTEVVTSKKRIEDHIGSKVTSFAYPYGEWNSAIRDLVAQHYRCACTTRQGWAKATDDLFSLPRIETHYFKLPFLFRRLESRTGRSYLKLRNLLRLQAVSLVGF